MFLKLFLLPIIWFFYHHFFTAPIQAQVIINEVYPNPFAGEDEWVELVNVGTSSVDLSDWVIQDKLSTAKNIFHFDNIILQSNHYLIASFSGQLNNSGDGVSLFDSGLNLISSVNYQSSTQGLSWSYDIQLDDYFLVEPTLNLANLLLDEVEESDAGTNNQAEASPSPIIQEVSENLVGKISLVSVMTCPENSSEWFELENISDHFLSEELRLIDEQDNSFLFSINLSAGQINRYYLDRHILNNSGDKISFIQGTDNILLSYQLPECKEKNKEFIFLNGQIKQISDQLNDDQQVLGATSDDKQSEVLNDLTVSDQQFEISKSYLRNLQLDIKKNPQASLEAEVNLDNSPLEIKRSLPIFTILLILTGIIFAFLGIMYLYGTEKSQDNSLD
jgi:hypothetical protein